MPQTTTDPTYHEDNNPSQAVHQSIFSTPIKPTPFYKRGLFLFFLVLLLTIGISASAFYYYKNMPVSPIVTKVVAPTPPRTQSAVPAPKFTAEKYTFAGSLPPQTSLKTYTLSPFSKEQASALSSKLGLTTYNEKSPEGFLEYSNLTSNTTRGIIDFNATSGTFIYQSYGEFIPETYKTGKSPSVQATDLIKYLDIYDDTISCEITYKNIEVPGVTYVECHRDWDLLSAPLLNLGGVLNLPENVKVSSLVPGEVNKEISPPNPSLVEVSNGGNGLARPSDFNTITVGLYPNGAIQSISSTMRKISTSTTLAQTDIATPQEAIKAFENQQGKLSLTIPAGAGNPDLNKVYPGNTALTEVAAISEITPAFLDKPFNTLQDTYEPYYLIRGTAKLSSGYTVRFTQVVPALKSALESQKIASEKSLQLNTFNLPNKSPSVTRAQTNTTATVTPGKSTLPTSSVQPTTIPASACQEIRKSDLAFGAVLNVPGYGDNIRLYYSSTAGNRTYSFVAPSPNPSAALVAAVRKEYFRALGESLAIYEAKTGKNPYPYNIQRYSICPARTKGDRCLNQAGIDEAIRSKTETKQASSVSELKEKSYPVPVDLILDPKYYSNTSEDQLLLWAFVDNYGGINNLLPPSNNPLQLRTCYITGNSPHIFVRSLSTRSISITTKSKLTYTDPPITGSTWVGEVKNNMFINKNGSTRSSIYYEYDPKNIVFTNSETGYIVSTQDLQGLVSRIAEKLGLDANETQALITDTTNALVDLPDTKFVKISLINGSEINKELPLVVSPRPDTISRIHLMLSKINSPYSLPEPKIEKVKRGNYSVLELGAYANK